MRFFGFRCYRRWLTRAAVLSLISLVSMTLWNSSFLSPSSLSLSRHHLPRVLRPITPIHPSPLLHPPLPKPKLQVKPQTPPKPDAKYAIGRTVPGCWELSDAKKPVDDSRLQALKNASKASSFRSDSSLERLRLLVKNCSALKTLHSYWRWPVTRQEADFPLAFGFKIHDAPEQFERLLRVLWRPQNLYVIHVDNATSQDIFQVVQDMTDCFDNVLMTDTRLDVVYASVISLHADIQCVKRALKSQLPWRYYLSVSGHEFPLRTNLEMVQILSMLNGTNDVENYTPTGSFLQYLRNESVMHDKNNLLTNIRRKPFARQDVEFRKGSAYFAATRDFVAWVMNDSACADFLVWLQRTWAADEMFWATANFRPGAPGGGSAVISHSAETFLSRAMAWFWDPYKCRGHYVRKVCTFGVGDLPWLLSRPELIANKFDNQEDPLVLDCLERSLEERAERGFLETQASSLSGSHRPPLLSTLNWTYYRALPHLHNLRDRIGAAGG